MLFLSEEDVRKLLSMDEVMEAVEAAFREYCEGRTDTPKRTIIPVREVGGHVLYMPSYVEGAKALAVKVVSAYPTRKSRGTSTVNAIVILNDPDTGEPIAVMAGAYITAMRTGAASGIATKYLARPDSRVVAVVGTGTQARTQLLAVKEVRKVKEVIAFDIDERRALKYAEYVRGLGIKCNVAESAEEAVRNADVVIVATTSKEPVIKGDWIREGTHVNSVGWMGRDSREVDSTTVKRSKVVLDSMNAIEESGDIRIPIEEGTISRNHIYGELCELVTGTKPGRENPREVTLFKSVGIAIEDAVTAKLAYEKAIKMGIGKHVSLS